MMGTKRRYIDATTGDYANTNGSHTAAGIEANVILALRTTRGTCVVAPDFGDRTNSVRKLRSSAAEEIAAFTREALQHLVDQRSIRDLDVDVTVEGTAVDREISYTDISGVRRTVRITRRVG